MMQIQAKECEGCSTGDRQETDSLSRSPQKDPRDFTLLTSKSVRGYISVLLSHPVCSHLFWQPQEISPIESLSLEHSKLGLVLRRWLPCLQEPKQRVHDSGWEVGRIASGIDRASF